jgi:hypothetical protein
MAKISVAPVKTRGVSPQEPPHPGGEIGAGCFDHEMKMIGHQAIGMNLPAGLLARVAEGLQEQPPVFVGWENRFPSISAIHDVIHRAFILHS